MDKRKKDKKTNNDPLNITKNGVNTGALER